jgi:hypothetical protein
LDWSVLGEAAAGTLLLVSTTLICYIGAFMRPTSGAALDPFARYESGFTAAVNLEDQLNVGNNTISAAAMYVLQWQNIMGVWVVT